ncbi:uncharacterized protein LOC110251170 isoform X2 [Exaiptasia diaphana]|nr:uncharacterized protein LOC110251170 isoform X2 [Exaiptasia diaphana]
MFIGIGVHENPVFNCSLTMEKVSIKRQKECVFPFIQWLQRNPKSNCRVEHGKFLDCMVDAEKVCSTEDQLIALREMFEKTYTEDRVCIKSFLFLPANETYAFLGYSCKMDQSEKLRLKQNACSKKLEEMWQTNRADKRICREYVNVKACLKKLQADAPCNKTKEEQVLSDILLGSFNPYCQNGVDPVRGVSIMKCPSYFLFGLLITTALIKIVYI